MNDYERTDWEHMREELRVKMEKQEWKVQNKDDLEKRAKELQNMCTKICGKHIKQKEMQETAGNWWTEELQWTRQKLRREAQQEQEERRRDDK